MNGEPTRACQVPISSVGRSAITTIEGLSVDGSHPVQRAWRELDVPQCGYCQTGQIMAAAALLAKTPHPADAEINAAMNGNLCRCATYLRIHAGVRRAAELAVNSPARPRMRSGQPLEPMRCRCSPCSPSNALISVRCGTGVSGCG